MYITDFTFNGTSLNSLGYVVCSFDKSSNGDISNGGKIEFKTVPNYSGDYHYLARSVYSECITATIQICKDMCVANYDPTMSVSEISRLASWLNSKKFKKLTINAPGYESLWFEGSFTNITRVEFGGITIGLTLEFTSNRPYALGAKRTDTLTFTSVSDPVESGQALNVYTDVLGDFYPKMTITCTGTGDLKIYIGDINKPEEYIDAHTTEIYSCEQGEVITMEYPLISSSTKGTDVSYNYTFQKLTKTTVGEYEANMVYVSEPCTITFEYYPAVNISI